MEKIKIVSVVYAMFKLWAKLLAFRVNVAIFFI